MEAIASGALAREQLRKASPATRRSFLEGEPGDGVVWSSPRRPRPAQAPRPPASGSKAEFDAKRSLGERSGSDLRDAHLLEQGQVILNVPIVADPAVFTFTRSVALNSIGCPLPCVRPNLPVKWPVNFIWTVT